MYSDLVHLGLYLNDYSFQALDMYCIVSKTVAGTIV